MAIYEDQKPDRVYMSYGGLGPDVSIEDDYLPASLVSTFLAAHSFVESEIGAGRLAPEAKLHLAGADAGRILKLTASRDARLDMDVLNKRFDPEYQAKVLRRQEEQQEDPHLRLILVKAAIRKAFIDSLGDYLGFSLLGGNTSVTEVLAENSDLRKPFFNFVQNAHENLGKNIFENTLLKSKLLRQMAVYTLSKRLRQAVDDQTLNVAELDREILYPLAQAGLATAVISQGHIYISPKGQNDEFPEGGKVTTPIEMLREMTAQVITEIMNDAELGGKIYNHSSREASQWQLREELIGLSLNKQGGIKMVDPYAVLGVNGDEFSKHPRIIDSKLQVTTAEELDEMVVPSGSISKGQKILIDADFNSVLRKWIQNVLRVSPVSKGLLFANLREEKKENIQAWLTGTNPLPGRKFIELAELYEGLARGIAEGVRNRIEEIYSVSYEEFVS